MDDNTVRKELDKVWDLLSRAWMRGGDGPALLAAARKKWRNEAIEEVLKYRVSTIYRCKPCDIVKVSDIEGLKND